MRDMSYFTNLDPVDYDYAAQEDKLKHVSFKDYKHLKDVNFDDPIHEPIWLKIMAAMGLTVCFIVILFIA